MGTPIEIRTCTICGQFGYLENMTECSTGKQKVRVPAIDDQGQAGFASEDRDILGYVHNTCLDQIQK